MINGIKCIVLVMMFSPTAWGQCSNSEIDKLDKEVGKTKISVESVYKIFSKISKCKALDGGIAEGFFDLSDRLLIEKWNEVIISKKLDDKKFRMALLKAVSDGTEKHTFDKICQNAKEHCNFQNSFCEEIDKQCKEIKDWIKDHPSK